MKPKIKIARQYLEKGFSIIPCKPDKRPLIKWEPYQLRKPTEADLRSWWEKNPDANIGIVTGKISGLTVVDCDSPEAWEWLSEYLPDSFVAPVVETPSGNRQMYFRHAPGLHSQNGIVAKLDLKSDGGYVIAPPSSCKYRKNGKDIEGGHRWQGSAKCEIPPMPEALFSELEKLQVYCGTSPAPSRAQHIIDENINGILGGVEGASGALSTIATLSHDSHKLFTEGRRDNDLFHTANCLVKGGMPSAEIAQVLEKLIISWGENPDPKWVKEKIGSALKRSENRGRSIAAEVREIALATHGHFLATEMHTLATITTREQKRAANETLRRMVDEGLLEHSGNRNGQYRLVRSECEAIDFENADDRTVDITLPFGLHELAETMPGNIIGIAGEVNSGKTALLLNIAHDNMEKFKIHYFSSEMGAAELKKRLKGFDRPLSDWRSVTFKERSENFADVIVPGEGVINIIDFLEVYRDFYEIGGKLADIHRKLKGALAVVGVQKNPGCDAGLGGWRGVEKPRLYLNISTSNVCRIVKAKNWVDPKVNPNGKETRFKIYRGCQISQICGWNEPLRK